MLVLTRKTNEEIVIQGDIRITVLGIVGNRVRIGITAPASVRVHRSELLAHSEAAPELVIESTLARIAER